MTLKKILKMGIAACLAFSVFSSVQAETSSDDESYRDPVGDEVSSVNWCSIGEYATGYAINLGYYANGTGSDPNIMSAYKGYIPGDCYSSYSQAVAAAKKLDDTSTDQVAVVVSVGELSDRVVWTSHGIVYLENNSVSVTYPIYETPSTEGTKITYINATSQRDAVLLDMYNEQWAKVMMSGAVGYVKLTNSSGSYIHEIIPLTQLDKTTTEYDDTSFYGYRVTRFGVNPSDTTSFFLEVLRGSVNSYMVHSGTAEKPSFMKSSKTYYSYDEHYFYSSLYEMIDDFANNTRKNALNSGSAYYNYYQYMPARSKTLLSASDFDAYLLSVKPAAGDKVTYCYTSSGSSTSCSGSYAYKYSGPDSILYNNGSAFLEGQTNYGINATMIYVKAILEGAYGQSTLARAKYNPFGVNAVDSAPFSSATKYETVYAGIEAQFQTLMSLGYANPYDAKGRYNGSQTGNKATGQNTMYASDPNWGWKLASLYRAMDAVSGYEDLNYYQLAVTTKQDVQVYGSSSMNTKTEVLKNYNVNNSYDFSGIGISVIIVDSATYNGQKVYKIVLERPTDLSEGYYYWNDDDYGWVYGSDIELINKAKKGYEDPADIGENSGSVKMETFTTPVVVTTKNSSVKMYDTYRTDITANYTTIDSDITFVAKRSVSVDSTKYYEVIIDYTTSSYRTRYILASDVSVDKDADLVITQASNVNTRSSANTSSSVVAQVKPDRSPLIYLGSVSGEEIDGNTTWYRILIDPIANTTAYISAAFASTEAANAEVRDEEEEDSVDNQKLTTDNYVTDLTFGATLAIKGLGVMEGIETPAAEVTTYQLVMTNVEDGSEYTHPLTTTTSDVYIESNFIYDYSWYEGNVAFNRVSDSEGKTKSLPTGNYYLAVRGQAYDATTDFQLWNKDDLVLEEDVEIRSGYTYSIKEMKSGVLYLSVKNESKELDLSSYSAMNMDVYMNSRVTSIKATSSGFTIEGYMFENASNNANYSDSRNWREIVFVSANDEATEYAYRKQVTPVYNTWLNSNKTATVDGKYKLNYANYKVSVSPSSVNAYVGNVAGAKMASGDYYVYMRISNGNESYVFPLVDRTLSDGTNMESDGTLPSGFTVYDQSTRALMYTVE